MIQLPPSHPLSRLVSPFLRVAPSGGLSAECLRASRPVFRFFRQDGEPGVVAKFFPHSESGISPDPGLMREYENYVFLKDLGLYQAGLIPRLLGRFPVLRVGLLIEEIPACDLDHFLGRAVESQSLDPCLGPLSRLAGLLACFHTRPGSPAPVSLTPARHYLEKILHQLKNRGLVDELEMGRALWVSRNWEQVAGLYPDQEVLLHGDATPTNFLFPDGRAVAIDLERLRWGDRLFDLGWVTGELRHAWGWRSGRFAPAEAACRHFLAAYLAALGAREPVRSRILVLEPFYRALALLRIARNAYLAWQYRRLLVTAALNCLTASGRLP